MGFVVGFAFGICVFVGSIFYPPSAPSLPLSVDECPLLNTSLPAMTTMMSEALSNVTTAMPVTETNPR